MEFIVRIDGMLGIVARVSQKQFFQKIKVCVLGSDLSNTVHSCQKTVDSKSHSAHEFHIVTDYVVY